MSWSDDRWRHFRRERLPVVVWSIAAVICGAVLGARAQRFEYYEWEKPAPETQASVEFRPQLPVVSLVAFGTVDPVDPTEKPEELQD